MLSFPQRFDASRRRTSQTHVDFVHFENPDFLNIVSYLKSQRLWNMFAAGFGTVGDFDYAATLKTEAERADFTKENEERKIDGARQEPSTLRSRATARTGTLPVGRGSCRAVTLPVISGLPSTLRPVSRWPASGLGRSVTEQKQATEAQRTQ